MKKLLTALLLTSLLSSAAIGVMAEENNKELGDRVASYAAGIDVNGKSTGTQTDKCKVTLTWDSLSFTFSGDAAWDPETRTWDLSAATWNPASNTINITSNSSNEVDATFSYEALAKDNNNNATLDFSCTKMTDGKSQEQAIAEAMTDGENGGKKITLPGDPKAVDVNSTDAANIYQVTVTPRGSLGQEFATEAQMGTITVSIEMHPDVAP